ncbi:MAG: hypothetical protein IPN13_04025 [Bacteroidetes bacterium]|nr:hypothetical protein [Bacteroidota bacterium]
MDDASKTYYDNNETLSFNGAVAAVMAKKSDQEFPYITAAGQQPRRSER